MTVSELCLVGVIPFFTAGPIQAHRTYPVAKLDDVSIAAAFDQLPLVQPVESSRGSDRTVLDTKRSPQPGPAAGSERETDAKPKAEIKVFDYRFDSAAHFPLPQPGSAIVADKPCGARRPSDQAGRSAGHRGASQSAAGAVIYEGMSLVANCKGDYQVQFTASVPSMPVTLHLQLVVNDTHGRSFVITLPPVSIDPEKKSEGNFQGGTYQVRHCGNSPLLASSFEHLSSVQRRGSARFGSLVQ